MYLVCVCVLACIYIYICHLTHVEVEIACRAQCSPSIMGVRGQSQRSGSVTSALAHRANLLTQKYAIPSGLFVLFLYNGILLQSWSSLETKQKVLTFSLIVSTFWIPGVMCGHHFPALTCWHAVDLLPASVCTRQPQPWLGLKLLNLLDGHPGFHQLCRTRENAEVNSSGLELSTLRKLVCRMDS